MIESSISPKARSGILTSVQRLRSRYLEAIERARCTIKLSRALVQQSHKLIRGKTPSETRLRAPRVIVQILGVEYFVVKVPPSGTVQNALRGVKKPVDWYVLIRNKREIEATLQTTVEDMDRLVVHLEK